VETQHGPSAAEQVKLIKRLFRARARDIWPTRS
jgi:hypothetical protein